MLHFQLHYTLGNNLMILGTVAGNQRMVVSFRPAASYERF